MQRGQTGDARLCSSSMKSPMKFKRVLVIGCPGAGKTALARRLAPLFQLPLVHLDEHYWKPGWLPSDTLEWEARVVELCVQDEWIIEGGYTRTLELRLERADCVVFLDYDRVTCLTGVLQRVIEAPAKPRHDLPPDCPERVDWAFLRWIWNYHRDVRPRVLAALHAAPDAMQVRLTDRGEADRWLASLPV